MRIVRSIHAVLFVLGLSCGGLLSLSGCGGASDQAATQVTTPNQEAQDGMKKTEDFYNSKKAGQK